MNDDDKTQPADPTVPVASIATTNRMARASAEVAGYELGEVLGRGGMGEVIAAHDPRVEREVALKRMRGDAPTADAIARFVREAKIQARLDHPAIVPVHELGRDDDGLPYFTMKRLTGTTLHVRLASAAGAPNQPLLRAFVDVCFAIDLAHSRAVVHRDLKPSNIMLGDYGEVYVLDWGVARVIGAHVAQPMNLPLDTPVPDGTATGAMLGTPGYMAPEQMRGEQVEPAVDIYALGSILFEILAGQPLHPIGTAAIASTLQGVDGSPSKRAPARNIAPELDAACVAALAEDPRQRPTARMLATHVQAYLDGDRDLDRRRALAAESLAEARAHEAAGDRVQAIRAAGRAVALDPESRDAAELATALILTPPRETPPAALAEIAAVEAKIERGRGMRGAAAYLAAWSLLVFAAFVRVASWPTLIALVIGGTAMAGIVVLHARGKISSIVLIAGNVGFGVLFERVGGPFLFTPLYACIIAIGVGTQVSRERRGVALVALALTLAIPVALELTGVLPRTFRMTSEGLLTNGTVYDGRATMDFVGMLIGSFALCALLVTYTLTMNRARKAAQREAALQAWHLRQLLPPPK